MKDFDAIHRAMTYPVKPKKNPPVRENFKNNTEWGIALDQYEIDFAADMAAYNVRIDAYHTEANRMEEEFWKELQEDLGWDDLPEKIASALRSRAWEQGHSSGYNEVYAVACDYSDLVNAIREAL